MTATHLEIGSRAEKTYSISATHSRQVLSALVISVNTDAFSEQDVHLCSLIAQSKHIQGVNLLHVEHGSECKYRIPATTIVKTLAAEIIWSLDLITPGTRVTPEWTNVFFTYQIMLQL